MKSFLAGIGGFVFLATTALSPVASSASHACRDFDASASTLFEKFNEAVVARGLSTNGNLIVVFVAPDTRTWSVLSVQPNGEACMVGSGENWEWVEWEALTVESDLQSF